MASVDLSPDNLNLYLRFMFDERHSTSGRLLREWAKSFPGRRWDPEGRRWIVPVQSLSLEELAQAGFSVEGLRLAAPEPASEVPRWFGLDLAAYQREGALAALAGKRLIADAAGLGKTRTALAALAASGARRSVVVCPPVVLSHWRREAEASGLAAHAGGEVVVFVAGRKEPALPPQGVVIVGDALLAARPRLLEALCAWAPQGMVLDEAHRAKSWGSSRSKAARRLARSTVGLVLALTGTPMFAHPLELGPVLAVTAQLDPVFGGWSRFRDRYARRNHFGGWEPRKAALPELRRRLDERVWVRRAKAEVLSELPAKVRRVALVDVDASAYEAAHAKVMAKAAEWIEEHHPSRSELMAWCRQNVGFVSLLRQASGLAKAQAVCEHIAEWRESHEGDPLVVWAHHTEVIDQIAQSLEGKARVATITGSTPDRRRAELVERFQGGGLDVLVCSITAAGVGITLTRASDVLFAEVDWTPALVSQAEDRCHRIGQRSQVWVTTVVAAGTLDEHIHAVLQEKAAVLEEAMGEGDHRVSEHDADPTTTPARLLFRLVAPLLDARGA